MQTKQMLIEVFHRADAVLKPTAARAWRERRVNVCVRDCRWVSSNKSGNQAVEFTLNGGPSQEWQTRLWLTPRALYRLVSFAKACGVTSEMARSYDIWSWTSHRTLLRRELTIAVVREEKGDEVVNWWPLGMVEADPRPPLSTGGFAVPGTPAGNQTNQEVKHDGQA